MATYKHPATGELFEFDNDAEALDQGFSPATDDDIGAHNREIEYGGVGQQVLAQVEGAIRNPLATGIPGLVRGAAQEFLGPDKIPGLTYDEPDYSPLVKGFGTDEEIRERDKARKEQYPIVSGVLDVAPEIALGIGTAGFGTGVAATAAAVAAEAGVIGASKEGVDSFLQDRKFSGELALANVAQEALMGGVAGGVFKLGGKAIGGLARGAKGAKDSLGGADSVSSFADNLLARAKGAAGGRGQKLPGTGGDGSVGSAAANDPMFRDWADESMKVINNPKHRESVIELAENADDIHKVAAGNAADSFNRLDVAAKDGINVQVKIDDIHKHARDWTPEQFAKQEDLILDVVKKEGDELRATLKEYTVEGRGDFGAKAKSITKDLEVAQRRALEAPVGPSRMVAIDSYKREAASAIKKLGHVGGAKGDQEAQRLWMDALKPHEEKLRKSLESDEVFGAAGTLQRDLNAGFSEFIEPLGRVQRSMTERLERHWGEIGAQAQNRRASVEDIHRIMSRDPDFAEGFVKDLDEALNGLQQAAETRTRLGYSKSEQLQDVMRSVSELGQDFNLANVVSTAKKRAPELAKQKGAASVLMGELESTGGVIGAALKAKKVAGSLMETSKLGDDSPMGQLLGENFKRYAGNSTRMADPGWMAGRSDFTRGLLERRGMSGKAPLDPQGGGAAPTPGDLLGGMGAAGKVGAAAVAGAGVLGMSGLAKAASIDQESMATVGALQSITESGDAQIDKTASNIASGTGAPTASFKGLVKTARESGNSLVVQRFIGDSNKTEFDLYRERSGMIAEMTANPESALESMSGWGDMAQQQPEAYEAISIQTANLVAYLGKAMPMVAGRSLTNPGGDDPDHGTVREAAARWQGATAPLTVLEDLENGQASEVAIDALKEAWPSIFTRLQISTVSEYQSLIESGERPPEWVVEQMSNSLGLGDMLGLMHSPKMSNLIQDVTPPDQEQPPQQGANIELKSQKGLAPSNALGRRE